MTLVLAAVVVGQAQTFTVLYTFTGSTDGAGPIAGLIRDAAGNLYGTTQYGGDTSCSVVGCGVVFKLDTNGNQTVLHSFTGSPDGAYPSAGLIRDAAGNLYGTTQYGGASGNGTVFKLDTSGKETVLYSFAGLPDGTTPLAGLLRDEAGNLYGTTQQGGDSSCNVVGCGVVFKLDTSGIETLLHRFTGGADGANPHGNLTRDAAGNLYGTTQYGGASGNGTVFKLDRTGRETVLHSFTRGPDGAGPLAGLTLDATGNVYGNTEYGGAFGYGTVFKLDAGTTHKLNVLHSFDGGRNGGTPAASLIRDVAGNLYGTAVVGGVSDAGVVFKLDTKGRGGVLYSFNGGSDGVRPFGSLIRDAAGNLYGTTFAGGDSGFGVVFKLSP
jgi:uncharacterized repeat protein (TIGR03803 family)